MIAFQNIFHLEIHQNDIFFYKIDKNKEWELKLIEIITKGFYSISKRVSMNF
jgi:hypothetical protein